MAMKEVLHIPKLIQNAADMTVIELLSTVSKTAEAVTINLKKLEILRAELKSRNLDHSLHHSITWTSTDTEERESDAGRLAQDAFRQIFDAPEASAADSSSSPVQVLSLIHI